MAGFSAQAVVTEARLWLGTPYLHQASRRGAGADCLGLVRGVWRALEGTEPALPPPYAADWNEDDGDALRRAADAHLVALPMGEPQVGDILLFCMRQGASARHMAIATSSHTMIHAYSGVSVSETGIGVWWRRRLVARYAYPGVSRP